MTTTINASPSNGLVQSADGSGILKVQSNGKTTNALAWVRWNGSTAAITSAYNVSSVTKLADGLYTLNFTSALSDTNYLVTGATTWQTGYTTSTSVEENGNYSKTTSSSQVYVLTQVGSAYAPPTVGAVVFGN